ncbi:hypothetical protein [Nocardia sp. NPDC004711]
MKIDDMSTVWPLVVAVAGAVIGALATLSAAILNDWLRRRRSSDKEQLRKWLTVFDRPAFRGPYDWKSNPSKFEEAIDLVIKAVNSGHVFTRKGVEMTELRGIGKAQLHDPRLREEMDVVVDNLQHIRALARAQLKGAKMAHEVAAEIDQRRDRIIETLNSLWSSKGLRGLPKPTALAAYEELYDE